MKRSPPSHESNDFSDVSDGDDDYKENVKPYGLFDKRPTNIDPHVRNPYPSVDLNPIMLNIGTNKHRIWKPKFVFKSQIKRDPKRYTTYHRRVAYFNSYLWDPYTDYTAEEAEEIKKDCQLHRHCQVEQQQPPPPMIKRAVRYIVRSPHGRSVIKQVWGPYTREYNNNKYEYTHFNYNNCTWNKN